jgi:hypothetical protein
MACGVSRAAGCAVAGGLSGDGVAGSRSTFSAELWAQTEAAFFRAGLFSVAVLGERTALCLGEKEQRDEAEEEDGAHVAAGVAEGV